MREEHCRRCGAAVIFVYDHRGKQVPIDRDKARCKGCRETYAAHHDLRNKTACDNFHVVTLFNPRDHRDHRKTCPGRSTR